MQPTNPVETTDDGVVLSLPPRAVAYALAGWIALLTAANLLAALLIHGFGVEDRAGFLRLFQFNAEANLPTLYQTFALFGCAALLFAIWHAKHRARDRFRVYWFVLALVFVYLGFDEGAEIHELATAPARLLVAPVGIFRLTWVVIALPIVAMFALGYLRFLRHLPSFYRIAFITCGSVFVGGALGVEMVGGAYLDRDGAYDGGYALVTTLEELFEKAAIAAFIVTLLSYLRDLAGSLRIELGMREIRG